MYRLINPIKHYGWGSRTLIPQLVGAAVTQEPVAEVWVGAHPADPSRVKTGGRTLPLDQLIAREPVWMLGGAVVAEFGPRLPFLAKLLAAALPLSIQVHPNSSQARLGFAAEQARGIPLASSERNYKDASHKPEVVYALTRFELLSGLREPEQSAKLVEELAVPELADLVALLRGSQPASAQREALTWILSRRGTAPEWVAEVARIAREAAGTRPELDVIAQLAEQFPGDPGLLAPYLLNYAVLDPGQAMFTGAGVLHAYLQGMAVEVMASSDNVLRAGLTTKHVDVPELLHVTDFTPRLTGALRPRHPEPGVVEFVPPVEDFRLSVLTARSGQEVTGPATGPRIALVIEGEVDVIGADTVRLGLGHSVFVPHGEGPLAVAGNGTVVVAYV